uniref:DUF2800 domain-containing protein n=1 Tax=Lactobacillus acetotolerans TaxID=1600 RepID=UPI002FD9AA5C
ISFSWTRSDLRAKGYRKSDLVQEKLIPLTKLDKLVKAEDYDTIISPKVIKPAGKPTLVPETDKRPAIGSASSAQADFG